MRIRKNGKVVRLTESDLQRIVNRTLSEGTILTPSIQDFLEMSEVGTKNLKGNKFSITSPDGKKVKLYLDGQEIDLVRTVKEME